MSHLSACTIVSNNYLAMAAVLASSYQEHHPGASVYVCVADRPDPAIDYESFPFVTVFAEDLGIPVFSNFAFRYDILELNTAVKPFLLTFLRDRYNLPALFYFDPDIRIMDTLRGLEEALAERAMVLTPHVTRPLDNTYNPTERKIRMLGIYNLGFLGLRFDERTEGFLEWWKDRLYMFCRVDPASGLFVDQAWMDFAPAFIEDLEILHDPIYNIAYWNLPHRHLEERSGEWTVDGRRIGFFHFSGLDFDDLGTLSRHQNRIARGQRQELRPLLEAYRDQVFAAGHAGLRGRPYGYNHFTPVGVKVPGVARRALQRLDPHGRRWDDPFDTARGDSFFEWLAEPLELERGTLTRAAIALWEERSDLIREFRDLWGRDLPRYVEWLQRNEAAGKGDLPAALIEGARVKEAPIAAAFPVPQVLPAGTDPIHLAQELFASLDLDRPGPLASWLNEPLPGTRKPRPVITRMATFLHQMRTDLQDIYPDPLGANQEAFAYWFCWNAGEEFGLGDEWIEPVRRSLSRRSRWGLWWRGLRRGKAVARPAARPETDVPPPAVEAADEAPPSPRRRAEGPKRFGVNLAGDFDTPSWTAGRLALGSRAALEQAGIDHVAVALDGDLGSKLTGGRVHSADGAPFPVTVVQARVERLAGALPRLPISSLSGDLKVAYTTWDLAHLPLAYAETLALFDEVWTPSRFCRDSLRSLATVPVRHVPPAVLPPEPTVLDRAELGIDPETFYLFASVDLRQVVERQNPFGAVEVIRRLRRRGHEGAGLLLWVDHPAAAPDVVRALHQAGRGLPVRVFTEAGFGAVDLLAASDAWLSLHRAAGVSVEGLAAFHLGKPVVATAWGGLVDVLDEETGFGVGFDLRRLAADLGPYPRGAVWAEPDPESAADQVERLRADPDAARRCAEEGRERVRETCGIAAASARWRAEGERLRRLVGAE